MTGGATPEQRVPMVVAIHGLGDRPEDFRSVLPSLDVPARLIFPRGFSPWHGGHSWFEFDRKDLEGLGDRISASADRVAAGIDALAKSRPTAGRPIVTGFSQGGMLSFAIAVRHPSAVSAAFPMGGMLPRSARPASAPEGAPPIFAWHGADDRLVPVQLARDTVAHLRGLGLRADLEELPGVGHTIPTSMRAALRERVTAAVRAAE
jgi:phospholipase/carboxylesterase